MPPCFSAPLPKTDWRAHAINAGTLEAGDVPPVLNALQIRVVKVRIVEDRTVQIRADKIRVGEVCPKQLCQLEICAGKLCVSHVGAGEISSGQIRVVEIDALQKGIGDIDAEQLFTFRITAAARAEWLAR